MKKNLLLLSGSYRGKRTTSQSVLNYLSRHLEKNRFNITHIRLPGNLLDAPYMETLLHHVNVADCLVLCSPKYNLSLPGPVMDFFDLLYRKKGSLSAKKRTFVPIVQFEAPVGGDIIQRICRCFSDAMEFQWDGCLILPAAGEIKGRPMEETEGTIKPIRKALVLAARDISSGRPLSRKTKNTATQHMPVWLIILIVNMLIRQFCKKNNVSIGSRPYENDPGLWSQS